MLVSSIGYLHKGLVVQNNITDHNKVPAKPVTNRGLSYDDKLNNIGLWNKIIKFFNLSPKTEKPVDLIA